MECALSLPKITSECSDDAIRKELVWLQYRARRGLPPAHDRLRVFAEVSLQRTAAAASRQWGHRTPQRTLEAEIALDLLRW
jgi:hypothetical protein